MAAPEPVRKVYWAVQIGVCLLIAIVLVVLVVLVVLGVRGGGGPGGYV